MTCRTTGAAIAVALGMFYGSDSASAQNFDLDRDLSARATQGCNLDVSPPAPRTRAAKDALKVLPPAQGVYLGAYQIPAQAKEVSRFANATERMPPIVFSFHDFFSEGNGSKTPDLRFTDRMEGEGSAPPLALAEWLDERGAVLALAWAIYCCDYENLGFWFGLKKPHDHVNRILHGELDDFIRQSARSIREYGRPLMLTLVPEMSWQGRFLFGRDGRSWMSSVDNICNEYGDTAWPDGPERIRDLYIRVIDIFRQEGVKNVTWFMYSSNQYMSPSVEEQSRWLHPKYYYPGDAYIDWVGQSVYFTRADWVEDFEDTGTFDAVFLPGYQAWQSVTSRPMFLPEFGIISRKDVDRRDMWQKLLTKQLKSVPAVRAVTIADSLLFQEYFDLPLLSTNVREIEVFNDTMRRDPYYDGPLRLGSH